VYKNPLAKSQGTQPVFIRKTNRLTIFMELIIYYEKSSKHINILGGNSGRDATLFATFAVTLSENRQNG
jgi:hypothetical protein